MEWLANQGLVEADAAVVLEPASSIQDSWQHLFISERGSCVFWLIARGEPGHSSANLPNETRASWAFSRALVLLCESDLFANHIDPIDGSRPTLNVGTIVEGGIAPWTHPESLRAVIEVRTLEGMTEQGVRGEIAGVLREAGLDERVSIEPGPPPAHWLPASDTVDDQRLIKAASQAMREVVGTEPTSAVYPGGTDSSYLTAAGITAIPAFGPGSLVAAHRPNEWIRSEELPQAMRLFEALIRNYHRNA